MQIIQWLLKIATEPLKETHHYTTPPIKKDIREDRVIEFSKKGVRRSRKGLKKVQTSELNCNNFNLFKIIAKRDIAKVCFHTTINLRRLGSFRRRQHFVKTMKMKKDNLGHQISNQNVESSSQQGHVGNTKVLPISDASVSSRMENQESLDKKERGKSDKVLVKQNRVPRLHQDTTISSTNSTHVWEPIEEGEGLLPVEKTFRVSLISITLSTKELNKSSPGYQAPAHDQQTRPIRPQNRYQSQQSPPRQPRGFYNDGGYEGSYGIGWGRGQGMGTNWSRGGYVTYVNYQGYIGYSNYGRGGGPSGWGYPGVAYGGGRGGVASRGYGRSGGVFYY